MKKKFTRILGVGLTVALLVSMMVGAVPVAANVSFTATPTVAPNAISTDAVYTIKVDSYFPLTKASDLTATTFNLGAGVHFAVGDALVCTTAGTVVGDGTFAAKLNGVAVTAATWTSQALVVGDNIEVTTAGGLDGGGTANVTIPYKALADVTAVTFATNPAFAVGDVLICTVAGTATGDGTFAASLNSTAVTAATWEAGQLLVLGDRVEVTTAGNLDGDATANVSKSTGASDSIYVEFPDNTTVPTNIIGLPAATEDVTLAASLAPTVTAGAVITDTTNRVVQIFLSSAASTSAADHMTITFLIAGDNEIVNPSTPGDYTLRVKSSQETTYVTSAAYSIGIPGVVNRYNTDGNYVGSYSTIQAALDVCSSEDDLKVGPGTYTTAITDWKQTYVELIATGALEDTIIKADITMNKAFGKITGITLQSSITATGDDITLTGCAIKKKDGAAETLLTSSGERLTVENTTIDTTYGSYNDTGIILSNGDSCVIDGVTFITDEGTVTTQDTAIKVTGAVESLMIENCTFTGTKGTGYYDHSGAATDPVTIKDNTFDGYVKAIDIDNTVANTELIIRNNTIKNSIKETSSVGAIEIDTAELIYISGNTFQDNAGYSLKVDDNAGVVHVMGNNFVNNTSGVKCTDATDLLIAKNNWWGDASGPSGEGTGTGDAVSTYVTYKPYLTVLAGNGQMTSAADSLDALTVASIKVSGLATNATLIWAGKYTGNPADAAPEYSALADAYYDVYIDGGTAPTGGISIKLYADGIDTNTDAYVWSALENKWVACSDQGASATGGYVWVTVKTTVTVPIYGDLAGLPFVLVDAPEAAAATFSLTAPEAGATVPILTNIPFTWASVTDAVSYDLVLSANADLSAPIAEETGIVGTAYMYTGTLTDGTGYYWQVTALDVGADVEGKSDVGTFIALTSAEAVVSTCAQCGLTFDTQAELEAHIAATHAAVVSTCAQCGLTFDTQAELEAHIAAAHAPVAPTTPMYIWLVIGIGALLVIAVLILIVRTRRTA